MPDSRDHPDSLRWQIELNGISTCRNCGGALSQDRSGVLQARAHQTIERAASELAHLRFICACCELVDSKLAHPEFASEKIAPAPIIQNTHLRNLEFQRREELRAYFQNAPAQIENNPGLRAPQIESYRAICDYFSSNRHIQKPHLRRALPAIVEIPTGCGKTGIICAAPFRVATGRVLVVTPNLVIKRNLVKSLAANDEDGNLNRDNFFLKCGIFDDARQLPRFVVLESGVVNLEDCLRADYVVANVQQLQSWMTRLPPDFFDMIIVDEAHHEPADSWQRVNEGFPDAKKIYLTATPFRCDGKMIVGETIYRYRLGQAIAEGYVKNVMKADAVAAKMTFTLDGESREFGYEEIMAMREELWFSKGVALSPLCNATIVERSIAIWKKKRESHTAHQIIGAACSIRHATQIVELFRERGVRSTHVASEGMSLDERASRIRAYENGEFDCIVHVGILGEGYDNPNISVAAIFRPYRSLSPYVQFVGRAIRWMRAGSTPGDNLAHVVSHAGLNLNFLWEYFKHETREAAILSYIDQLFFDPLQNENRFDFEMPELDFEDEESQTEVTGEELLGWDVDVFLRAPEIIFADYFEETTSRLAAFRATAGGAAFQTFDRAQDRTRRAQTLRECGGSAHLGNGRATQFQNRLPKNALGESTLPLPFHRPDLERRAARKKLHKDILRASGAIAVQLRLGPDAELRRYLCEQLGESEESKNCNSHYEMLVRAINRRVNELMSKERSRSNRNDWTIEELESAQDFVREARGDVLGLARRALQDREQIRLPLE